MNKWVWGSVLLGMIVAMPTLAQDARSGDLPGTGRRDQAAPVFEAQADAAQYLVVLRADASAKSVSAGTLPSESAGTLLPVAGLPEIHDPALAEVLAEIIGLGAAIHQIEQGKQASFVATLDVRARRWLSEHPQVLFIDGSEAARNALRTPTLAAGGQEFVADVLRGNTDTRILRNGAIIGFGATGYQQPEISSAGNMFADAAGVLGAYGYVIQFNGSVFTASRQGFRVDLRSGSSSMTLTISSGQNTRVSLPEAAYLRNGRLMAPVRVVLERAAQAAIIDWDQDTRTLQSYDYRVLDTGIYFYGIQQNAIRTDQPGAQRYIPGQPNPFFNANNPTIIYSHGWQKDGVVNRGREGFLFTLDGQWQNVQNYWITRGWNVGIFHWVQLADDDFGAQPVDSEKKIYDANSRGVGMRWKNSSGQFNGTGYPTINVSQIYRQAYLQVASAMAAGREIRLIGNSLGGNLTVAMVRELAINQQRLPLRITLQDPYWDFGLDATDGVTLPGGLASNRDVGRDGAARIFNAGLAFEYFRSSVAGQAGYVRDIARIASYTNLKPEYTSNPIAKHTQPTRVYLWSFDFAGTIASPRTGFDVVRSRMNIENHWDQRNGTTTATPADDAFVTISPKPN